MHVVTLVARTLLPRHGGRLERADIETVIRISRAAEDRYERSTLVELFAFSLALGLMNESAHSPELAAIAFEAVHEAASQNALSEDAWATLEPHVPYLWSRKWDKCERLRLALLDGFVRYRWPGQFLVEAVTNASILRRIADLALQTVEGRRWLRGLRPQLDGVTMSSAQEEVIEEARVNAQRLFDWWA